MATAQTVATWMVTQIQERGCVSQRTMSHEIKDNFGEEFTYRNHRGRLAIDKLVLREFGKLKQGRARWDKKRRWWYREPVN